MSLRKIFGICLIGGLSLPALGQDPPKPQSSGGHLKLTVAEAERLLTEQSLAYLSSRQQVDVAEAIKRIANYKPNPTIQVGMEQVSISSPIRGSYPRFFATNPDAGANPVWTMSLSKVIERGGKRELRTQQAEFALGAAKALTADSFRTQLFQLRQAFGIAQLAQLNYKIASEIDKKYGQTEQIMQTRLAAGDIAGVDLERVRAARLPFRQAILDAQNQYLQATQDILNILNIRLDTPAVVLSAQTPELNDPVEIEGDFDVRNVTLPLLQLREMALKSRGDLNAARSNESAAERGIRLAEAQRKRDITTGFEYQRVGEDNSVGVTMQFPLFLYNNGSGAIAQSIAQQKISATQTRLVERQVLADVDRAYQSLQTARQGIALYSGGVLEQLRKIRETIFLSYQRGQADLLDVLDAERSAGQAQLAYNTARSNYQTALWQLESAVGETLPKQ